MKTKVTLMLLLTMLAGFGLGADPTGELDCSFSSFYRLWLPGGEFFPSFLENYFPDTVLLMEESGGFSLSDHPRVYYEGDSQVFFNWYYRGIRLNSLLYPGSTAVVLPLGFTDHLSLQTETPLARRYGLRFDHSGEKKPGIRLRLISAFPNLGSYSSLGPVFHTNHAQNRDDMLYETRRKYLHNHIIDLSLDRSLGDHMRFSLAGSYYRAGRQFNDFNPGKKTFEEDAGLLMLGARLQKRGPGILNWEAFTLLNARSRSHQDAELGRVPQETGEVEGISSVIGGSFRFPGFVLRGAVTWEWENIGSAYPDYSKDLMDNDGEGIGIENRLGDFAAVTLQGDVESTGFFPGRQDRFWMAPYCSVSWGSIQGNEWSHHHHCLFFDQEPVRLLRWEDPGERYRNHNLWLSLGTRLKWSISEQVEGWGRLFFDYQGLSFQENRNNFSDRSLGFDAGLLLFKKKRTRLLLAYGFLPYRLQGNVNFFLETNRPSGTYYQWTDQNANGSCDPGEEGEPLGFTGGRYHQLDPDLKVPVRHRFLLSLNSRLGPLWQFRLKGIYKGIAHSLRVRFTEEYGGYRPVEGRDVYFYDQPFRDHVLSNLTGEEDPFYAQIYLQFRGQRPDKWFFNFSFMAHIGMGTTPFGNGAGTSDTGLISESTANPNSLPRSYGRLDGDRAFVGRCFFGFYLFPNCHLGVGLKYRDGNPFAFIEHAKLDGQHQLYYHSIKAEDQYGNKPGPREDYLSELNVKIGYSLAVLGRQVNVSVSFFNLLDFGSELSEYVFFRELGRPAAELQIPRSILLSVQLVL